ncbi:ribonuclease HII [Candidatus Poribacteria bacterium]|nr:MAG: ribonuclease HII [Candidatus Poribacteria bacterium]
MPTRSPLPLDLSFEFSLRRRGYELIAGVDEAGRGPLAGPVVAAAVLFPPDVFIPGVCDSKRLSPERREELFEEIQGKAISIGIGIVDSHEIDRINILNASLKAMRMAVECLHPRPQIVLVDGPYTPQIDVECLPICKGDRTCFSIAAASIVAKVIRDRMMIDFHRLYPQYGFDRHKGYPTPQHYRALAEFGPCPIHRRSFNLRATERGWARKGRG